MQREINDNTPQSASEFFSVRCRINGGIVDLELSVEDIRRALGLPNYSLCPPYRAPVDAPDPLINMHDVDHQQDEYDSNHNQ
jgi:hypothetical protein